MTKKRDRKFWIGVGSGDHVEEAVQRSFCLLSHSTETALEAMHPGDGLALFVKRPTDHAAELVERFEAIGIIGPGTAWTRGRDGGVIRRLQARWMAPAHPVHAEGLAPRLDFIKNAARWRASLARDRKAIGREDFARIADAMDLPGFAWEIRHDRGLDFAVAAEGQDAPGVSALERGLGLATRGNDGGPFRMRAK
ncbi:hypothetical protein [Albimonas pacifica]|uniref:Uncharacterized protein n=1 Tax=Albimonas pacifica TaxID=1114924 RepID=A0A1I3D311_9RHOB|nr:hypothetical protein [Albimonas pacifica]SFH80929.1 hypothetical protein SAMN05216258_102349 [Albimonas pacifica]